MADKYIYRYSTVVKHTWITIFKAITKYIFFKSQELMDGHGVEIIVHLIRQKIKCNMWEIRY